MGDRGNIAVRQDKETNAQIWLYTHWGGTHLPQDLQSALTKFQGRWNDDSYLTRNILSEMIPDSQIHEETGFGISTRITDNEHEILVVCVESQTVFLIEERELKDGKIPYGYGPPKGRYWPFSEYCKLKKLPKI